MKTLDEIMPVLQQLLTLVELHFGTKCEVVLHDLTKDYNHTIVDIRNGDITHRSIGGCGSNLGLEVLRGTVLDGTVLTTLPPHRMERSCAPHPFILKMIRETSSDRSV